MTRLIKPLRNPCGGFYYGEQFLLKFLNGIVGTVETGRVDSITILPVYCKFFLVGFPYIRSKGTVWKNGLVFFELEPVFGFPGVGLFGAVYFWASHRELRAVHFEFGFTVPAPYGTEII